MLISQFGRARLAKVWLSSRVPREGLIGVVTRQLWRVKLDHWPQCAGRGVLQKSPAAIAWSLHLPILRLKIAAIQG